MTALKEEFTSPASPLQAIVNYVWINEEKFIAGSGKNDPQCGIPLHYVDKVIQNAKNIPKRNLRYGSIRNS